ncbi:galactose oxidase [Dyadobacter chenwenxiniae]|uniref:Galactose oxidase n=1 Tax=Dyadobacter chenwenxiniae TaxID=2906456 RepID=A0A9X1PKH5_9BACT|nr:galactose oxidase [Dyadobacter chenwenxiniae]MCF0060456.1 galactose oxidase [Dyadobacter chenwenxiniae]UON86188.1 galactose oxidase [Dyadobacter chenwenxiniae]
MFSTLRKISLTLLAASMAFTLPSCENDDVDLQGNWFRKGLPSFGGSIRTNAVSFVIGDIGYIGTGYTNETVARVKDFWAYNTKTKIWSQVADFPGTGRNNATAFVLKGKGYVGTGYDYILTDNNGYKKDFYQYDPVGNKWSKKADFAGGTRQFSTSFVVNDRAFVGLGYNGTNTFQDFYEYDPTGDKWVEMATFIGGKRTGAITFTIDNTAYVGFGRSNSGTQSKDFYSFDPSGGDGKGAWTRIEFEDDFDEDDFPARAFGLAMVINSKAYIVGGEGRSDVWEYDARTNDWTERASFPGSARGYAGGFVVGSIGYFGTGSSNGTGGGTDDFWGFDPTQETDDDDDI